MKKAIITILVLAIFFMAACENEQTTPTTTTTPTSADQCGDSICAESERCDTSTYQTNCAEDCPACPTSIYVENFQCGNIAGCEKTGENKFTISSTITSIKVKVANLGDTIANSMEVTYSCYDDDNVRVLRDFEVQTYKGTKFNHGFVNAYSYTPNSDKTRLQAKTSQSSTDEYVLTISAVDLTEDFNLKCDFVFDTHSPIENEKQSVYMTFKKE
ncbi:MAG: hypothetical protein PHD81_03735 [Candidatus Nanoarchaeia archaeon]|nr:hypothetical protein [Candidatus Nanoarchaeia archaeon]MDD5588193.1 hypothetical protein [Candidatus Nanoarchaeia archaeon]